MSSAISIEHLSKAYRLGEAGTGTFVHDLHVCWAKVRGKPNLLSHIGEMDHGIRGGWVCIIFCTVLFYGGDGVSWQRYLQLHRTDVYRYDVTIKLLKAYSCIS